jgi:hypothetical protein
VSPGYILSGGSDMKIEELQPAGVSWVATSVLLLIGTWYNVFANGELGIVGIVLSCSMAIYFIAYLVLRRGRSEQT